MTKRDDIVGHIKTVSKHKRSVLKNCLKARIPIRGLLHDMSKFSPTEFLESINYYTGTSSPIDACKRANGVSYAWMHHKGRNRHHYEYWQDNFDRGGHPVQMPYKDALEQVCDFIGAGQAYMGDAFTYTQEYEVWWKNKISQPIAMHPQTLLFTEYMLHIMAIEESNDVLKPSRSKQLYEAAARRTQKS